MTTIQVAKTAGVSQATVSRVINKYPGVSPDVVRAVRDAMRSVGYVPRPRRGKNEVGGGIPVKTRNVLVIMLDESCIRRPTLSVAKQRGVSEALSEAGMNMVLVHCVGSNRLPPVIEEGKFDGALLWGHQAPRAVLDRLENKPVIWLSSHSDVDHDCVLPGNESVGRLAANYFIERGCRRLAYLSTSTTHPGLRARRDAFVGVAELARRDVRILEDDLNIYRVYERMNFQQVEDSGMRFVQRLLELNPRPTGIFSPDDALTSVVHRGLLAAGVSVGHEVALVSCNNETPYLANLHPRPATIDLGPEVTGRRAVEQLLWRIRHGTDSRRVQLIIEPVLVPGELDGPTNMIPQARV